MVANASRFLRARKFDPVKAQNQFQATENWRKEHDVDNLFANFDPVELESARRFYPRWTGRRDKVRGRFTFYTRSNHPGSLAHSLVSQCMFTDWRPCKVRSARNFSR